VVFHLFSGLIHSQFSLFFVRAFFTSCFLFDLFLPVFPVAFVQHSRAPTVVVVVVVVVNQHS